MGLRPASCVPLVNTALAVRALTVILDDLAFGGHPGEIDVAAGGQT
jgi:hypothetical protein